MLTVGVVYGTDVICTMSLRPAPAPVDDRTLVSTMGRLRRTRTWGVVGFDVAMHRSFRVPDELQMKGRSRKMNTATALARAGVSSVLEPGDRRISRRVAGFDFSPVRTGRRDRRPVTGRRLDRDRGGGRPRRDPHRDGRGAWPAPRCSRRCGHHSAASRCCRRHRDRAHRSGGGRFDVGTRSSRQRSLTVSPRSAARRQV